MWSTSETAPKGCRGERSFLDTHMTRRSHYITVKFFEGKLSSVHWSPPKDRWPLYVRRTVDDLRDVMQMALDDGDIKREKAGPTTSHAEEER